MSCVYPLEQSLQRPHLNNSIAITYPFFAMKSNILVDRGFDGDVGIILSAREDQVI